MDSGKQGSQSEYQDRSHNMGLQRDSEFLSSQGNTDNRDTTKSDFDNKFKMSNAKSIAHDGDGSFSSNIQSDLNMNSQIPQDQLLAPSGTELNTPALLNSPLIESYQ